MTTPLLVSLLSLVGIATAALTINWSTVDGGGGHSFGGTYTVSGTIGQPDTAAMSGGAYALTGGFWAMPEVIVVPNGPLLTITREGPQAVRLNWPAAATGWRVQFTTDMQTWLNYASTPVSDGTHWSVQVPVIPGNTKLYFRLALN